MRLELRIVHQEPSYRDSWRLAEELLNRRGWALQEFVLSPRIIFFSAKGPLWKCHRQNFDAITPATLNIPILEGVYEMADQLPFELDSLSPGLKE